MTADMDYFRLVRRTDPSYTARTAIVEYMHTNPHVAIRLVQESDIDDQPFGYDELESYLRSKGAVSAFFMGQQTPIHDCDVNAEWFELDGYGYPASMSHDDYVDWCIDAVEEHLVDDIVRGKVAVPSDLQKVLALWGPDGERLCRQSGADPNIRPGSLSNRKSTARKTTSKKAPAKKTAGQTKKVAKAPSKKATSRNVKASPNRKTATGSRGGRR